MEIYTTGRTLADKAVVLQRLQQHLKLKENQAQALVDRKVIIKRGLNDEQARLYCKRFKQLGLDVMIRDSSLNQETLKQEESKAIEEPEVAIFPVSLRDFEEIFKESITRPKVSLSYKTRLLGVAILSLLTPMIYLGLIGFTGWGTITYFMSVIGWVGSVNIFIKIIILSVPTFIGVILFFFLIKPFFAKRQEDWGFDLQNEDAPALFNLIDVMCDRIGINPPTGIRIDNSVNAAAGPEKGIFSLLQGEMCLYIGLPLLTGMSAKQFVGVMAHEFGHFAQPSAMLTYQLINRVNHWLYDRAYNHDSWDDRLEELQQIDSWIIAVTAFGAKVIIKLTRIIFRQMYLFNHRITQSMSRQMEYDADAYESIFCGSDSFKQTSLQLRKLSHAANKVYEINENAWYENKLLRDYAGAVYDQAQLLSDEEMQQIEEQLHSSETNAWDSHPADTDRIKHVELRGDKGIFKHQTSARNFCKDFDNLSERATRYQYVAGRVANVDKYITDNDQILERHTQREESYQSLEVFFAGTHNNNHMLAMNAKTELLDANNPDWKNDWQQCVDQLRKGLADYKNSQEKLDENTQTYCIQQVGRNFLDVGFELNTEEFKLGSGDVLPEDLTYMIENQQKQLATTEALFQKRINYALQVAQRTAVLNAENSKKLLRNFIFIEELSSLRDITKEQFQLAWITNELMTCAPQDEMQQEQLQKHLRSTIEYKIWENLNQQWNIGASLPDMVDNPESSLLDYIESVGCKKVTSFDQLTTPDLVEKAYQVTSPICYQYATVLAELVESCLIIEKENGIKPIKLA